MRSQTEKDHWALATEMARVSFEVYDDIGLDRHACFGYYVRERVDAEGTTAYILTREDKNRAYPPVIVAFRGTEFNYQDIITDLDARFYKGTHRGFAKAYDAIDADLRRAILKYIDPINTHLIFTGHSLGGALAQLGASMFDGVCFSFGAPRLWTSKDNPNTTGLNFIHNRFVNGGDVIPLVPFKHWSYKHYGQKTQIGSRWRLLRPLPGSRFRDHRITEYCRVIEAEYSKVCGAAGKD